MIIKNKLRSSSKSRHSLKYINNNKLFNINNNRLHSNQIGNCFNNYNKLHLKPNFNNIKHLINNNLSQIYFNKYFQKGQ